MSVTHCFSDFSFSGIRKVSEHNNQVNSSFGQNYVRTNQARAYLKKSPSLQIQGMVNKQRPLMLPTDVVIVVFMANF